MGKPHYHLMKGSATNLEPEHTTFYPDLKSCETAFDEEKDQYISKNSSETNPIASSISEHQLPSYTKVCEFARIDNMKELHVGDDGIRNVSGKWLPKYMIMLVECTEDDCFHDIN